MVIRYKKKKIRKQIMVRDYKKTLEDIAEKLKNIYDYLSNDFFKKNKNIREFSIQGDYLRSSYANEKGKITKKSILSFLKKRVNEAKKKRKTLEFEIDFVSEDKGISFKFETPKEYLEGLKLPFVKVYEIRENKKDIVLAKYEYLENICKEVETSKT